MGGRRRRQSRYLEKLSALSLDVGEIVLSKCPWNGLASPQPEAVRSYLRPWPLPPPPPPPPPPPSFSVKGASGLGTFGLLVLVTLSLFPGIGPVRGRGRSVSAGRLRPLLCSRAGLVGGLLGRSPKGLPGFLVVGVLRFGQCKSIQWRSMRDRPGRTTVWWRRFLRRLATLGSFIKNSGYELDVLLFRIQLPFVHLAGIRTEEVVTSHRHYQKTVLVSLWKGNSRGVQNRTATEHM